MTKEMNEFYSCLLPIIISKTKKGLYKWVYFIGKHSVSYRIVDRKIMWEVQGAQHSHTYSINGVVFKNKDLCEELTNTINKSAPRMLPTKKGFLFIDNPIDQLYKQVPYSGSSSQCPFCSEVAILKPTDIIICKKPNYTKRITTKLLYCVDCEIAFADNTICEEIKNNNDGLAIETITTTEISNARKLIRKYSIEDYAPAKTNRITNKLISPGRAEENDSHQFVDGTNTKLPGINLERTFISDDYFTETSYVPFNETNYKSYHFIAYSNERMVHEYYDNSHLKVIRIIMPCKNRDEAFSFNGLYDKRFNRTYIDECIIDKITAALSDFYDVYWLNNKKFASIVKEREQRRYFDKITSSSVALMIAVDSGVGGVREYYIVNEQSDIDHENNIYHYSEEIARELLTAAYYESRHRKGRILSKDVRIEKVLSKNLDTGNPKDVFLPSNIYLKSDGGLNSSVKNKTKEVITILLYSPYTKRYECINVTHDKSSGYCYVDPGIFRKHIHKYGNPGLDIRFMENTSRGYGSFFNELNSESILFGFGYNVNASNGLTDKQRHDILADIMDLEVLTASKIISQIEFNMNSHSGDKYELARSKWANDIAFVQGYNVNPSRFLIARDVSIRRGNY